MLAGNALATYFKINLAATVLGVFLVSEILMLGLMTITVLVTGGGPEGWSLDSLNPLNAFINLEGTVADPNTVGATLAVAGSAGIGLFFAFWSWVGFESAAMYGEESRNPTKIIPRATMLSVVGIGDLLRDRLLVGHRRHRSDAGGRAGPGQRDRRADLLRTGRAVPGQLGDRCCSSSC